MFTYQNPKLSQHTRQQIFNSYQEKGLIYNSKGKIIKSKRKSKIEFKRILSDNGKEFKGSQRQVETTGRYRPKTGLEGQHHQVELLLEEMGIKHSYTQVRRPQTNGKVERLNRTISDEFLTKVKFENRLHTRSRASTLGISLQQPKTSPRN